MKITFKTKTDTRATVVLIPFVQSSDLSDQLTQLAQSLDISADRLIQDFSAKYKSQISFYLPNKPQQKVFLIGLGKSPEYAKIKNAIRSFSFRLKDHLPKQIALNLTLSNISTQEVTHLQAIVNGLVLGGYNIGLYKTQKKKNHPFAQKGAQLDILTNNINLKVQKNAAERGLHTAQTQLEIFDLVNAPGNKVTPKELGDWAKKSGKTNGFKVKVLNKRQIEAAGLHSLLAVNRGSEWPPAFIIMEYLPKNNRNKKIPTIGLVGKGITFDTGGISIKDHNRMHLMKSDMGGAAAVLGAMQLTARLQLPVHLIGIVPASDNCVDAKAVKPGDVINSYSGKTIEIIDTDAEGRLVLADGLAYVIDQFKPEVLIDLATLTGSSVRTFGYHAAALFTNNDALQDALLDSGIQTGERSWPLPLWDDYDEDIQSDVADVRNFSGKQVAGAISAAKFLEAFTNEHPAWAHMDIAGVAFGHSEFSTDRSATAYGVHLLTTFIENYINQK